MRENGKEHETNPFVSSPSEFFRLTQSGRMDVLLHGLCSGRCVRERQPNNRFGAYAASSNTSSSFVLMQYCSRMSSRE